MLGDCEIKIPDAWTWFSLTHWDREFDVQTLCKERDKIKVEEKEPFSPGWDDDDDDYGDFHLQFYPPQYSLTCSGIECHRVRCCRCECGEMRWAMECEMPFMLSEAKWRVKAVAEAGGGVEERTVDEAKNSNCASKVARILCIIFWLCLSPKKNRTKSLLSSHSLIYTVCIVRSYMTATFFALNTTRRFLWDFYLLSSFVFVFFIAQSHPVCMNTQHWFANIHCCSFCSSFWEVNLFAPTLADFLFAPYLKTS